MYLDNIVAVVRWNVKELAELRRHSKDELMLKKSITEDQIHEVQERCPELTNRTWIQIKAKLHYLIKHNKEKLL